MNHKIVQRSIVAYKRVPGRPVIMNGRTCVTFDFEPLYERPPKGKALARFTKAPYRLSVPVYE